MKQKLMTVLLLVSPLLGQTMHKSATNAPQPRQRVTVAEYFARLSTVRNAVRALPALEQRAVADSARDVFEIENAMTDEAYQLLASTYPPDEVATEHFELMRLLDARSAVNRWIIQQTPRVAGAHEATRYQYRTPEVGQVRAAFAELGCRLDAIAVRNKQEALYGTNCLNVENGAPPPVRKGVLGSPEAPVSVITLRSEGTQLGAQIPAPDLSFGFETVYAKAGQILMTYDNQNPAPFQHNAVVYRNATGKNLKASQVVAGTPGGSGPMLGSVSFRLEPGEYTIVCNVHLDLHMAKLIVVP